MGEDNIFIGNSIYPDAGAIFRLAVKPINEIKDNCIFVIDTNALLVPYTASSESLDQIRLVYSTLVGKKRLIIPGQVAREFAKNRPEKIKEIFQQLNDEKSKIHKLNTKSYPLLNNIQEYQEALRIEEQINGLIKEYGQKISELQAKIRGWTWNDPVSSIYNQLFPPDAVFELKIDEDAIKKELTRRYEHKIPPGYKDGSKPDAGIGDLLIWYTILEVAKTKNSDVIFVSGDEKADWFYQSVSQSLYPRFELVMEFVSVTGGKSFHIIKLSEFLNLQGVDEQVIKEVKEIEEVQNITMEYEEREKLKEVGREKIRNGKTVEEKADGLFMIIEAHWHRNRDAGVSLEEYARHWLWATDDNEFGADKAIFDLLRAKFPPPEKPMIKKGYSDWGSFGNPAYKG